MEGTSAELGAKVEVAGRGEVGCVDGDVGGAAEGGDVEGEGDEGDGGEDEVVVCWVWIG